MILLQDIRYGLRMLAARPGVTAAAVLSLGLGVGANTAVFSLIDAIMLKSLPVESPEELVILGPGKNRGNRSSTLPVVDLFSYPRYRLLRDGVQTLGELAAIGSRDPRVYVRRRHEDSPSPAYARLVSGNYFSMLGVRPAVGRLLGLADDAVADGHPVVVLDHGYWQERLGADPSVAGSSLVLGDRTFTIVGVVEPSFRGERPGDRPDMYVSLQMDAVIERREPRFELTNNSFLLLLGRLAPRATKASAEIELAGLWQSILLAEAGEQPSEARLDAMERAPMTLQSGARGFSALDELHDPLRLLFAVTALVLLIASANVANLLLARSAGRGREMGVRVALGADRKRLFVQVFTESLLLALLAGAASLLIAVWGREALVAMASGGAAQLGLDDGADARILVYTAAVALGTGLLFGTAPAWRASGSNTASRMRTGGRGTVGGFGKLSTALVVGQAALSLLLLFGAGLFVESLDKLARADTGIAAESLLTVTLDPRGGALARDEQPRLARRLLEKVEAVPGVRSASMALLPLFINGRRTSTVSVPGYDSAPEENLTARIYIVTPRYFETVGTEILAGRSFDPRGGENSAATAIVDQVFAQRYFEDASPVGQSVRLGGDGSEAPFARIVGLARTAKLNGVRETQRPTVYLSAYAQPDWLRGLMVRAEGDPAAIASAVRRTIVDVEPRLPISDVATAETRLAGQSSADRMLLQLISSLGMLALLLAAVGLYGVLSYRVAGRTSEIGLRMAVGADRGDVLRLVLGEGLALAAAGVALGIPAALLAGRAVESFLYQTEPWNVRSLVLAAGVLLIAALLAGLAPSLRAARLNPCTALREE